ncbi:MAG: cytochrome c oxidase subunit II [Alphaproteobacteria bacterium]|nr:cytochrome c oxidase subunit II [Alphaproteobacteria bacterium]
MTIVRLYGSTGINRSFFRLMGMVLGLGSLLILMASVFAAPAWAEEAVGMAKPWQMMMAGDFSPMRDQLVSFHNLLLVVIFAIVIVVLGLLVFIMVRFSAKNNSTPQNVSHNTLLEVVWTVVPILILMAIAVPSIKLLYFLDKVPKADMTVKVVGRQWSWSYSYPDEKVGFDSEFDPAGQPRQLAVNNAMVVPVNSNIRILVTSADVMHSWFVPTLGVQIYATPGRTNETWLKVNEVGTFYGQCNQICGIRHAFMPIKIVAMSQENYANWLVEAKQKFPAQ